MIRQKSATIMCIEFQMNGLGSFCGVICRQTDKGTKRRQQVLRIYINTNAPEKSFQFLSKIYQDEKSWKFPLYKGLGVLNG